MLPFLLIFLLCSLPGCSSGQDFVHVERVVDGDTFVIAGGGRVRMIGIDTPETVHPERPVEPFGPEASAFAKQLLDGNNVRLEFDVQERDKYGRLLAYVFLEDGRFANAELVREGLATVLTIPPNVRYVDLFVRLQREARLEGRGMWREGERIED